MVFRNEKAQAGSVLVTHRLDAEDVQIGNDGVNAVSREDRSKSFRLLWGLAPPNLPPRS